ncbi:MAG: NAD(P)H-hydrate epimerase, partial [Opitutae bacterium]
MHHPILTCAESLNLEHSLLAADPEKEWEAMNLVGQKLAHQILLDFNELRPFPRDPSILVLAGKGHNGGDALLAAHQLLKSRPRGHITVLPVRPPGQLRPNTLRAFEALVQDS